MPAARPAPRLIEAASLVLVALLTIPAVSKAEPWERVPPEDLKSGRARVDSTADAEALFWKIRVEDVWDGTSIYSDYFQYVRIQVFNERGAAARNAIVIPYDSKSKIQDLAARVIRPDGTTSEIAKNAVFERVLLKAGGRKLKQKSFAFPDLKPGSIVEYRWTERRYDRLSDYLRVDLQRDAPVRALELRIKPLLVRGSPIQFRINSFHGPTPAFDDAPDGSHSAELRNVRAFRSEPRMPPENAVRHWILLQYRSGGESPPTEAWRQFGKTALELWSDRLRPDGTVKKAAAEVVAGESDEPEKVRRLVAYCRTHVRNVDEDAIGTPPIPDDIKDNETPGATLRRGIGTSFDIQCLFMAMASAIGIQTRPALLPDPEQTFDPNAFTPYFLTESCVATWADGGWTFRNPAERYTGNGSLPADQEGRPALILDASEPRFLTTPMSSPHLSEGRRRGTFQLAADGTVEGDVTIRYSGHWGEAMKEEADDGSPEQREKNLREQVRSRIGSAQLSDVRFEHALDAEGPYTVSYHLHVPGYATRVGKRLIFDPAVFEIGSAPEFQSEQRLYPVLFPYSWAEDDSVLIRLPTGFRAEALPQLEPLSFPQLGGYDGLLATSMDGTTLMFRRRFEFGRSGTLYFPASEYPALKKAFDAVAERDAMSISLTETPEGGGN